MPKLTVENVEIKTAAVEIRVITLSNRGITQALFKQFPERPLVAENGTLNGVPWGWVNYHPEKCDDKPHLHAVWQRGSDVFRSRVDLGLTYPRWIDTASATAWVDAKVREDAISTLTGWQPTAEEFTRTYSGISVRMPMSKEAQKVTLWRDSLARARQVVDEHGPDHIVRRYGPGRLAGIALSGLAAAREAAARVGGAMRDVTAGQALADSEEEFEKALSALPVVPLVDAEARLAGEVRAEVDRRRRHREVRQALTELPQLYIAK